MSFTRLACSTVYSDQLDIDVELSRLHTHFFRRAGIRKQVIEICMEQKYKAKEEPAGQAGVVVQEPFDISGHAKDRY